MAWRQDTPNSPPENLRLSIDRVVTYRFRGNPLIGGIATIGERDYRLVDIGERINARGKLSKAFTWEGCCLVCGDAFHFQSGEYVTPYATCPTHRGSYYGHKRR